MTTSAMEPSKDISISLGTPGISLGLPQKHAFGVSAPCLPRSLSPECSNCMSAVEDYSLYIVEAIALHKSIQRSGNYWNLQFLRGQGLKIERGLGSDQNDKEQELKTSRSGHILKETVSLREEDVTMRLMNRPIHGQNVIEVLAAFEDSRRLSVSKILKS